MEKLIRLWFGFGIIVSLSALVVSSAFPQFPDPKDQTKLYELAKKEGTIVWYNSMPLEPAKDIAKDFEARFPGIKVEILRIVGIQQYQRFLMETNAKQYMADILYISDYPSIKSLSEQGHLVEWKVPTSDRIPAVFRIGNYSYCPDPTDNAIVYNVNKVTPEEIKILSSSWKSILDPRFKGRFTVQTHKCGACYAAVHMFLDPKNAKVFGPEFIKAVAAQKPTAYPDSLVAMDRVIAGEHDFTFWTWEKAASVKWQQGAPIRWIHPSPTPEWGNSWYAVSKYSPHPNAARLYLNWITGEEGALSLQKNYFSRPVLEGVRDILRYTSEPWYDPIRKRYDVDWDRWTKNYNKDMDFWIKTVMESK